MNYLIIIFSLVIGVSAIWTSWKLVRFYFKIGSWKRVEAKVLSKKVVFNNLSNSQSTPYTIVVEYAYTLDNKEYRGNKLDLVELIGGFSSYRKPIAERQMSKIKEVETIYVNPLDHSQSLMNRRGIIMYLLVFILGIFSILYGVTSFFF